MRHQRINFPGCFIFTSMFNDISCGSRDTEKECESNARLVSLYARRIGKGQWSFCCSWFRESGILSVRIVHKEYGTIWLKGCCWNSQKVIAHFSALRAQCPEVASEAKDMENCRLLYAADLETIETFSHNCLCKFAQSLRSSRRNV